MSARFLPKVCAGGDAATLAYCEAYLDAAAFYWRYWEACADPHLVSQSYCMGVTEAQNSHDGSPPAPCMPGDARSEAFCAGFNRSLRHDAVVMIAGPDLSPTESSTAELGAIDGAKDAMAQVWAGGEFFARRTCLSIETEPSVMRKALLDFVAKHPEQTLSASAVLLVNRAMHFELCPDLRAGAQPHRENCLDWGDSAGDFGAANLCDTPVLVRFLARDGVVEETIEAGSRFSTGSSRLELGAYAFTACPPGTRSTIALRLGSEAITNALYDCAP